MPDAGVKYLEWWSYRHLPRRALYHVRRERGGLLLLLSHLRHSDMLNTIQLWVCGDGTVVKFKGDVEAYKVCWAPHKPTKSLMILKISQLDCQQYQG
jgi:hypothetical protein